MAKGMAASLPWSITPGNTCTMAGMSPPPEPLPPVPEQAPLPALARWLLLVFAALCLALGVIGIVVPGLPSTVFILMAGWAAARSSPRLYRWLWFHPLFGSMLRNWANGGRVSRHAKWSATFLMALCALVLWVVHIPRWATISAVVSMACVLVWLWLRPEPQR